MSSTAHDQTTCTTTPCPDRIFPSVPETHRLISNFLPDFLRLAEPDSAAQMCLEDCTILPLSEDDHANLIRAQVKSRLGEQVTLIVAIEPEALPTQQIAEKLARVLLHSELTYRFPVLLSVIYLSGGRPGLHLESAQSGNFGDVECVRMYFTTWSLSESHAEYYLKRPEPLAWALSPLHAFLIAHPPRAPRSLTRANPRGTTLRRPSHCPPALSLSRSRKRVERGGRSVNDPSRCPPAGARMVLVDGPFDPGHDDPPNWTVSYLDDDGEDVGTPIGRTTDQSEAQRWGHELARRYRLELNDDSDAP